VIELREISAACCNANQLWDGWSLRDTHQSERWVSPHCVSTHPTVSFGVLSEIPHSHILQVTVLVCKDPLRSRTLAMPGRYVKTLPNP